LIRLILSTIILSTLLFASSIKPSKSIKLEGTAQDMVYKDNSLIISTNEGKIFNYNIKDENLSHITTIPKIKDFMGDEINAKIFSVDYMDGRYLFLSDSGKGGFSNLWIKEDGKPKLILSADDKLTIIKARFIDKDHALLGLLSNEALLLDIPRKKILYRVQLEPSKFSDFALNEDRSKAVFSCESGVLSVIDTKNGHLIKKLKGVNKDNVYKVAFRKDIISGAGKDKRGSIYHLDSGNGDFFQGNFMIYATAISPELKKVAFVMDENNDISIYDLQNKNKLATLHGQKGSMTVLIFKDEGTLFSAGDDNVVNIWKLKEKK